MQRDTLKLIFGETMPVGATSFASHSGATTFCIGATGALVDVPWTDETLPKLREAGALGTFGVQIIDG